MPIAIDTLHELLDRAMEETFGLIITTDNAHALQLRLYKAMGKAHPSLMICVPSRPGEIFVVKRSVELDP